MSTTMPDGGLHGFSNFPSPFPPIETHPPLDQNENITIEKSNNGYKDMESSSNELPTEPSTKEVAERIVPQPPSDTEPSVNTEEVSERIVPQPQSDKERPVYVFPTEHEIIRPSSSLPVVDDERPNGIRPIKIQQPRTPFIDAVAAHDKSNLKLIILLVIRNHPSALEIYKKKLLETGQATKEDIDRIQNKVTLILNDEFLAARITSLQRWTGFLLIGLDMYTLFMLSKLPNQLPLLLKVRYLL
ncbi:hypothetical protein Tco_0121166 [Tanacetum coccineum]